MFTFQVRTLYVCSDGSPAAAALRVGVVGAGYDPCEPPASGLTILGRYGRRQAGSGRPGTVRPPVCGGRLKGWSVAPSLLFAGAVQRAAACRVLAPGAGLGIVKRSSHNSAVYSLYGCTSDCLDCGPSAPR